MPKAPGSAPRSGGVPAPPGQTVLLVDDEEDILELLGYTLEREGYRVLTARDGVEGLRAAEADLSVSTCGARFELPAHSG